MAEILIEAAPREAGSSNEARRMRRERKLPAVVYGGGKESHTITLDPGEIVSILKSESGQNTIFKLKIADGSEENVMIFDVQIDPIKRSLVHADLLRIAMDVTIEVSVPLLIVGEAAGVIEGGVLDHSLRELLITCLPADIPESIEVDVTDLEMNQSIKVEDIQVPANVTVMTEADRSVASVVPPVSEADLEADLTVEGEEPVEDAAPPEEEGVAAPDEAAAEAEEKTEKTSE